jgi:3-oxoadipate enol-lactonase
VKGRTGDLAWSDCGTGAPILLIRPLGGSVALWGDFARELQREHRVLAFDARGSGDSQGHARISTGALAADALAVLDARGVERAHVFGISLGGMVATRFALAAPSRVAALVVASAPARGLAFERAGLGRAASFAPCFARSAREAERCLVTRVLSRRFRAEHPEEAARIEELAARTPSSHATILAHLVAAARHDARAKLVQIRTRTLVLAGDRDHLLGASAGMDLERGISGASRVVVKDSGHDLTLEQPHATAKLVFAFVNATTEAPSLQPPPPR